MGELERRPNAWALTPLVVFLLTYLVILKSATIIQYTIKGRFMSR